jgi:hypothetical protein
MIEGAMSRLGVRSQPWKTKGEYSVTTMTITDYSTIRMTTRSSELEFGC